MKTVEVSSCKGCDFAGVDSGTYGGGYPICQFPSHLLPGQYDEIPDANSVYISQQRQELLPNCPIHLLQGVTYKPVKLAHNEVGKCVGVRGQSGCGYIGGKSGRTCPECGGMILSDDSINEAIKTLRSHR
jgi:hypothetical protein